MKTLKKIEGKDIKIKSNQVKHGTEMLDEILNNQVVLGSINPVSETTITYGCYIIYKNILIISFDVEANENIAIYYNIARLSEKTKGLINSCYIYSTNDKSAYINKSTGYIAIYSSGGMPKNAKYRFFGLFNMRA